MGSFPGTPRTLRGAIVATEANDRVRAGLVLRTEPDIGAEVELGSRVVVVRSSGRAG